MGQKPLPSSTSTPFCPSTGAEGVCTGTLGWVSAHWGMLGGFPVTDGNIFIVNWSLLYNSLVMTAQGRWRLWLGDLNCHWMWELNCLTALNLFTLGQVSGTWTKHTYLSIPLPCFSPKALVCGDRTVVLGCWSVTVCIESTCMWPWAWLVELSEPQTPLSLAYPAPHSFVGSSFSVCTNPSVVLSPFPTTVRKPFLNIQNVASTLMMTMMTSQGYPCVNQMTSFLSLCLCCPLIFTHSAFSRAPQAPLSPTLHFFQPLGYAVVCIPGLWLAGAPQK